MLTALMKKLTGRGAAALGALAFTTMVACSMGESSSTTSGQPLTTDKGTLRGPQQQIRGTKQGTMRTRIVDVGGERRFLVLGVGTDASAYASGSNIVVNWTDTPGNSTDWVAISPVGSSPYTFSAWAYTNGQVNGNTTFVAPAEPGQYEARVYFNNSYQVEVTSAPFTISADGGGGGGDAGAGDAGGGDDASDGGGGGAPTVTTDKDSYLNTESAVVTYANFSGGGADWIGISLAGSGPTEVLQFQYTSGTSGQRTFALTGLADGTYEARGYFNNSYTIETIDTFTIGAVPDGGGGGDASDGGGGGPAISTNMGNYTAGDTITVNFSNFSGSQDWVSLALVGSGPTEFVAWQYTGGGTSGSLNFNSAGFPSGSYEARGFFNNSYTIAVTSNFTIGGGGGGDAGGGDSGGGGDGGGPVSDGGAPGVSTDKATYANTETAVVGFWNFPGNSTDWLSIAVPGSGPSEFLAWQYTGGTMQGTRNFPLTGLADGTYEVRGFLNNGYTIVATTTFTIGTPVNGIQPDMLSYPSGADVIANYNGAQGTPTDWISVALPGSSEYSLVTWQYTNGSPSGSRTFSGLPNGTYVLRLYNNNGYTIAYESQQFTVGP